MRSTVITISRQFGSGGRLIGAELSKELGIPCYENALYEEAARNSGIHPRFFEQAEGRGDLLNIFIYAERAERLKRAAELYGIAKERAERLLDSIDKNRFPGARALKGGGFPRGGGSKASRSAKPAAFIVCAGAETSAPRRARLPERQRALSLSPV